MSARLFTLVIQSRIELRFKTDSGKSSHHKPSKVTCDNFGHMFLLLESDSFLDGDLIEGVEGVFHALSDDSGTVWFNANLA